ncbi:hypothetical protein ENSA5_30520 [Enhygromyxa salina]|uniref:Uncharacterized protein n=1 Tax=Enhygromyxa salina TaxID=215803 RepID=A0A2S9XZP9_9BACT|nr:cytochrome C oxidase subunit IV family protein [Enhygromyxa salina]PRP98319.1 hypothetical protein ENSA5_30520 [Enhygromyxa salina]
MAHADSTQNSVYLNGKPVENPHEDHHHVSPVWEFTAVFVALLILTILTYVVSFAGLGPASLPVAMIIAGTKGALVALFFMHLKYEDRFYGFVFAVTLLFVAIFFTLTLFDMSSTDELNEEAGIKYKRTVEDSAEAAESAAAMKAAGLKPAAAGGGGH